MQKIKTMLTKLVMVAAICAVVGTAGAAASAASAVEVEQVCCDYECTEYCVYPKKVCVQDDDCRCAWPGCYPYTCCPAAGIEN